MTTTLFFGQPDARLLPGDGTSHNDSQPPRAIPAPVFSEFQFTTIGQQPGLLKRISTPDPESTQYRDGSSRSPSSSPDLEHQLLPSDETPQDFDRPRSRPSLLEALTGLSSVNPDVEMSDAADNHPFGRSADSHNPIPIVQESRSGGTARPHSDPSIPPASQIPTTSTPGFSQGTRIPDSAGSTSFVYSQPPGPNQHLREGTLNPCSAGVELTSHSRAPENILSSAPATSQSLASAEESLKYPSRSLPQHPDQNLDSDYTALRELQERILSSLSNLNTPNISEALHVAQSANAQCEAVLTAAQRAHSLAQHSLTTAQESLALSRECLDNAEQAKARAGEAIIAVEKIGPGKGEGQQQSEWSEIISGIRGDLHTLGAWVERREAEDARRRELEKRSEGERQKRITETITSNQQTPRFGLSAPPSRSPTFEGGSCPIAEYEADAAARAWSEHREMAEKQRIAREIAQKLRDEEVALLEANRRQEEVLSASKAQLSKLHSERLRAEEEERKQRDFQESRRFELAAIEQRRVEADKHKAEEMEKAKKDELARREAEALEGEKQRVLEAEKVREAQLRQEQDIKRRQIMEEKQRANAAAAEEIRANRAKGKEATKTGNGLRSSQSKTPPGTQIAAAVTIAQPGMSKIATPAQFGNVTSTKTLTSSSPDRLKTQSKTMSGGVKLGAGNNKAPDASLPAKPPVNAAMPPKSSGSFMALPKRHSSAVHATASLLPIQTLDASDNAIQVPMHASLPGHPSPDNVMNGRTTEILANIRQDQTKGSPRTIYTGGDRHVAGTMKPHQSTAETPRPISFPPIQYLPENSLQAPSPTTPTDEHARMSVHHRGPDAGNIPVVPLSRLGVVSPDVQAANLRFVINNNKPPDENGGQVKHEPCPENASLLLSFSQMEDDANEVVPPKVKKARQTIEKKMNLPKVESPIDAPLTSLPSPKPLPQTNSLPSTITGSTQPKQKFPNFKKLPAVESAPPSTVAPSVNGADALGNVKNDAPSISARQDLPSQNTQENHMNGVFMASQPSFHESSPPRMGPDLATGSGGWQHDVEEIGGGWRSLEQSSWFPEPMDGDDNRHGRRVKKIGKGNRGGAPMMTTPPMVAPMMGDHYTPPPANFPALSMWPEERSNYVARERGFNSPPYRQYPSSEWNARPPRADTPPLTGRKRYRNDEVSPPPAARRQRYDNVDHDREAAWQRYEAETQRERYEEDRARALAGRHTPEMYNERSRPSSPEGHIPLKTRLGPEAHDIGRGHRSYRPSYADSYIPDVEPRRSSDSFYPQLPVEQWHPEHGPNAATTSRPPQHQTQNQDRRHQRSQGNRANDPRPELINRLTDSRETLTPPPSHAGKNASRQSRGGGNRGGGARGGGKSRGGRGGNVQSLEQRISSKPTEYHIPSKPIEQRLLSKPALADRIQVENN